MDNNFSNQNTGNDELEQKIVAETPIVPAPDPMAGMQNQPLPEMNPNMAMGNPAPNPMAGMGQPAMDQTTGFGQPAMGQTTMGQPAMDTTQMGFGQPAMGQPAMDTTQMGVGQTSQHFTLRQPSAGETTNFGQPAMDTTQMGFGQPAMGQQPGFGQPAMGQQMGFGQPAMGQPTDYSSLAPGLQPNGKKAKVKKPKKPMTKGKLAGIIAGSTVGVAAIVCGVIFIPKLFRSPKKVVLNAIENTFGMSSDVQDVENDKFGIDEMMNAYYTDGGETNLSVTMYGDQVGVEGDMVFYMNNVYDPNEKIVNLDTALTYNDTTVIDLNLLGTENNTYIQVPSMIDGYFSFPNDLTEFLNSPIFGGQGLAPDMLPDFAIDYFKQSEALMENGSLELNAGYVNALETLWDNVSVKKKGKKKIDVNGETIKATKYIVTIDEKDIEKAAQEAIDGVIEALVEQPELLDEAGLTESDLRMLASQFDISSLISGDFSFDVYVKDDKVVKVEAEDTINISYLNLKYHFFLDIDDDNISSQLELSVPMAHTSIKFGFGIFDFDGDTNGYFKMEADDERFEFTFDSVRTEAGTVESQNFEYEMKENGRTELSGTLDVETDSSDDSFEVDFTMAADGEEIGFGFKGEVTDYSVGESIAVAVDDIYVEFEGEKVSGIGFSYSIDTTKCDSHDINTDLPVYDLTTLTETEFDDIIMENSTNIMNWYMNLLTNTGDLGAALLDVFGDISEPVPDPEPEPAPEPANLSFDDAILSEDGYEVKIENAIDGYILDYISDYYIDLVQVDDDDTFIEYEIETDDSPEDFLYGLADLDCEIHENVEDEVISVEGADIRYSMVAFDTGDGLRYYYIFARQIDDGAYVIMSLISSSSNLSFDANALAVGLSDAYITIY